MKDLIKQFTQREASPFIQFIKYGISGVAATVVDVTVFYILCIFVLPAIGPHDVITKILPIDVPEISETVRSTRFAINSAGSFIFANFTAYLLNIFWVFERGRHKWYVELGLFYAVSGIAIVIGTFLGWVLIRFFGMSTTFSYVTKGVSALLINYVCRKFFIFKG